MNVLRRTGVFVWKIWKKYIYIFFFLLIQINFILWCFNAKMIWKIDKILESINPLIFFDILFSICHFFVDSIPWYTPYIRVYFHSVSFTPSRVLHPSIKLECRSKKNNHNDVFHIPLRNFNTFLQATNFYSSRVANLTPPLPPTCVFYRGVYKTV